MDTFHWIVAKWNFNKHSGLKLLYWEHFTKQQH